MTEYRDPRRYVRCPSCGWRGEDDEDQVEPVFCPECLTETVVTNYDGE